MRGTGGAKMRGTGAGANGAGANDAWNWCWVCAQIDIATIVLAIKYVLRARNLSSECAATIKDLDQVVSDRWLLRIQEDEAREKISNLVGAQVVATAVVRIVRQNYAAALAPAPPPFLYSLGLSSLRKSGMFETLQKYPLGPVLCSAYLSPITSPITSPIMSPITSPGTSPSASPTPDDEMFWGAIRTLTLWQGFRLG